MLTALQGVTFALYLGAAPLLAWVGWTHSRRPVTEPDATLATRFFAAFWLLLSFNSLLGAIQLGAFALGLASAGFVTAIQIAMYASVSAMMAGLAYYLVYLFWGRTAWMWPIVSFYGLMLADSFIVVATSHPVGLRATRWGSAIEYQTVPAGLGAAALGFAFLIPPTLGAIAYGAFIMRVDGPTPRYRVALVSVGIFVWFVTSIVVGIRSLEGNDIVQGGGRAVTLASILMVIAAYHPPRWIQKRLGVEPIEATPRPVLRTPDAGEVESRRAQMAERLRGLI